MSPTVVWSYCLEVSKSQKEMGQGGRNGLTQSSGVTELSGKSWESGEPAFTGQSIEKGELLDGTLCDAFPKSILLDIRKPMQGIKSPKAKETTERI